MTPQTLTELFEMDRKDITFEGDTYALNQLLKLPPWSPTVVEVWRDPEGCPEYLSNGARGEWDEVLELLNQLHDEHKRRKA